MDAAEELLVLRLPPKLAARIGARIDKYDRSRGDPGALLRRRKKKGKDGKTDAQHTLAVIQAIWGEDGILDYDSLNRAEDLLFLDVNDDGEAQDSDAEGDQKSDKESDVEDAEENGDCEVEYWKVEGNNYIFKYGEDEYYATLVTLPCVIEAQKTTDNVNVYKSGNVTQMLLVHDVKASSGLPRPNIDANDMHQGTYAHGLTPPMRRVAPDRYAKLNPAARAADDKLLTDDIRRADTLLFDFKQLVLQKDRRPEVAPVAKESKGKKHHQPIQPSTYFVHEEVIDAEPWMEYADEVIVVEQGDDNFKSSTKQAQSIARDNKSERDANRRAGITPGQAPGPPQLTASENDVVAQFRMGSIGNVNFTSSISAPAVPKVSLAAPPVSLLAPPMPLRTSSPIPVPVVQINPTEDRETFLRARITEMEAELGSMPAPMRERYNNEIAEMRTELQDLQNML